MKKKYDIIDVLRDKSTKIEAREIKPNQYLVLKLGKRFEHLSSAQYTDINEAFCSGVRQSGIDCPVFVIGYDAELEVFEHNGSTLEIGDGMVVFYKQKKK